MFILLPSLVLMEVASDAQKYSLMDIFKVPNQQMPFQEIYFCIVMMPVLVYLPGDAVVLTVASYDKQSHNPVVISAVCLVAKWLVAYMFMNLLFYAEGLAPDPQCESLCLCRSTLGGSQRLLRCLCTSTRALLPL